MLWLRPALTVAAYNHRSRRYLLNLWAPLKGIVPIDELRIPFLCTTSLETYMHPDDSLLCRSHSN